MTVTYTAKVATVHGLGCFWLLLFRWKGSIYKLIWPNFLLYVSLYVTLSLTYRMALDKEQRIFFEKLAIHCQTKSALIPISFILAFYISIVVQRWWEQYMCMPWPDSLALYVSTLVPGQDERGRLMRRTIMRYANLSLLMTLRMISPAIKKRFPTFNHITEAGFMLAGEKKIVEDLESKVYIRECIHVIVQSRKRCFLIHQICHKSTKHAKYWMPLVWAGAVVTRARKEGRIKDDFALKSLVDELNRFRMGCGGMLSYDWISIPLVYTQVVTIAVYMYFLASLMGNQFLDPAKNYQGHSLDMYVPIFSLLEFFFYMGWLKVAETLINPFGEDDDDFELNWLIDRNIQVSYVIVDEMHQEHPDLVKDQYWDEVFPAELPYTMAAKQYNTGSPVASTDEVKVSEDAEFLPLGDESSSLQSRNSTMSRIRLALTRNPSRKVLESTGTPQVSLATLGSFYNTSLAPEDAESGTGRKSSRSSNRSSQTRLGVKTSQTQPIKKPPDDPTV